MNATEREAFEERAAILQFEAGMTREEAEAAALAEYRLKQFGEIGGQA